MWLDCLHWSQFDEEKRTRTSVEYCPAVAGTAAGRLPASVAAATVTFGSVSQNSDAGLGRASTKHRSWTSRCPSVASTSSQVIFGASHHTAHIVSSLRTYGIKGKRVRAPTADLSPFPRGQRAPRWICHRVYGAWPVQRRTCGYLPSPLAAPLPAPLADTHFQSRRR